MIPTHSPTHPCSLTTRKSPRPHQSEALAALTAELAVADRVTAVLPCGTGKTLLSLWLAEAIRPTTVLVLEPTLSLLRQNLHEWRQETSWTGSNWMAVCSDDMSASAPDALVLSASEMDFPTTTDAAAIRAFLAGPSTGVKVVYCTYQSVAILVQALPPGFRFDLGIFDEAHKTAGVEGKAFAKAISDDHLPIAKRAFFTATPKHSDVDGANGEIDEVPVFAMNDPNVYGKLAYHLTHRQAVQQGIIVDYKVVISVITRADIDHTLIQHGKLRTDDGVVSLHHMAHQVAIAKACETYGLRKVITFHDRVESASRFQDDCAQHGLWPHGKTPRCFHVNGTQSSAERARTLKSFRDAEFALVTNARCLTEGIDVPNVDLVAFLSPRRSLVDVVQAVGRALRTAPSKQHGYVLLPLYLDAGNDEDLDAAIARADLSEIRDVLHAMREQDDLLAEAFRRRNLAPRHTPTDGGVAVQISDQVAFLASAAAIDALQNSIATRVLEQLSTTWDQFYLQLLEFHEKHGHCRVPREEGDCTGLAGWVARQRRYYKADTLAADRHALLEKIGFVFDVYGDSWNRNIASMRDYIRLSGNSEPPFGNPTWRPLNIWAGKLRKRHAAGTLTETQIRDLEAIGFIWNPAESRWLAEASRLHEALLDLPARNIDHVLENRAREWYHDNQRRWAKMSLTPAQLAMHRRIHLLLNAASLEDLARQPDADTIDNRSFVARHQRLHIRLEQAFVDDVRQQSEPLAQRYRPFLAETRQPDTAAAKQLVFDIQAFLDAMETHQPPAWDTLSRLQPELKQRGFRKRGLAWVDTNGLRIRARRPDQLPLWRHIREYLIVNRNHLMELCEPDTDACQTQEIADAA